MYSKTLYVALEARDSKIQIESKEISDLNEEITFLKLKLETQSHVLQLQETQKQSNK